MNLPESFNNALIGLIVLPMAMFIHSTQDIYDAKSQLKLKVKTYICSDMLLDDPTLPLIGAIAEFLKEVYICFIVTNFEQDLVMGNVLYQEENKFISYTYVFVNMWFQYI